MLGDVQRGSRMKFGAGATTFLLIVGACYPLHKASECAQRFQSERRGYYEMNEIRHGVERVVVELEDGKELMAVEKGSAVIAASWTTRGRDCQAFRGKSRAFDA
jgi:hypothetical protein